MAKSIFVTGNNRSGTKWLSNILLNHSKIAGVQSEYHGGILEINLFQNMPIMFGPLDNMENFVGFIECFSATDFFRLTGLPKDLLFKHKPVNYYTFFNWLMNEYVDHQKKEFWLKKIHSTLLENVYSHFKDTLFVIIERNVVDTIRSAYVLQKRVGGPDRFLKELFIYHYSKKIRKKFSKKKNVLFITYEQLLSDREAAIKKVCEFLNIPYSSGMLDVSFRKNTSFAEGGKKVNLFPRHKVLMVKVLSPVLALLPLFIYKLMFKLKKMRPGKGKRFVTGTFSINFNERGSAKFNY